MCDQPYPDIIKPHGPRGPQDRNFIPRSVTTLAGALAGGLVLYKTAELDTPLVHVLYFVAHMLGGKLVPCKAYAYKDNRSDPNQFFQDFCYKSAHTDHTLWLEKCGIEPYTLPGEKK